MPTRGGSKRIRPEMQVHAWRAGQPDTAQLPSRLNPIEVSIGGSAGNREQQTVNKPDTPERNSRLTLDEQTEAQTWVYDLIEYWRPMTLADLKSVGKGSWELCGVATIFRGMSGAEPLFSYVYHFKQKRPAE